MPSRTEANTETAKSIRPQPEWTTLRALQQAPEISDYGLIGDCHGAALVSRPGSIDWYCTPRFDAQPSYRLNDYTAAAIPVLPVKRGVTAAKRHIVAYILAFIMATLMLTFAGYTGYRYFVVAFVLGLLWLFMACVAYKASDDRLWSKKLFMHSILTIVALSVMMSIDFTPVVGK